MKITDVKAYTMDAFRTNWAFVKVETDEGLYGWGEATLGTQEKALEGCIDDFKRLIVGATRTRSRGSSSRSTAIATGRAAP